MTMSIFMGLEIGKRSIMTHQTALSVTGHNIANANTVGYTRQSPTLVTTRPHYTPNLTSNSGIGQLGTGVEVAYLERLRDAFLDGQIRNENKTTGYWSAIQDTLAKIEVILNEPSNDGLRTVMDQFWESWQDLSAHPESESVRAVVAQRGAALADAFNHTYQQLTELREDVNAFVRVKVDEINSIAQQMADLNQQILSITIAGKQPNDLLDKRDLLIDELSRIADVTVNHDHNGMVSVQLGGRPLVQGKDFAVMDTVTDKRGMHQVVWADTKTAVNVNGGELRGLLDARGATELDKSPSVYAEIIPNMIEDLNQLAKTIILRTNEIHRGGFSLNNQSAFPDGMNFFTEPADGNWAQMMQVDQQIVDDPKNIAAARYHTWEGGIETNFGDGAVALMIAQLKHDYNIQQYTASSGDLTVTFPYDAEITFSVGVVDITIPQPSLDPPQEAYTDLNKLADAIQQALDNKGLALNVRTEGRQLVFYSTETFAIQDFLTEDNNLTTQAPDDNDKVVNKATTDDFWRSVCAQVGVMSQESLRMVKNQDTLLNELENKRQSVSGVSLDEEMTNMIKFQHAYNAASRFITTIDEAIEVIVNRMGLVGR
ncbi:MAG: flagellar hook-associated protein FlgK [Syntrophomonadaceae bacterium]|jgi:flagellar hook-associated protein 1 FlgK